MATSILGHSVMKGAKLEIVSKLPETGKGNQIYFVSNNSSTDKDIYDEYIWINNSWEFLGNKRLDLTIDTELSTTSENPVQNKAVTAALQNKVEVSRVDTIDGTVNAHTASIKVLENRMKNAEASASSALSLATNNNRSLATVNGTANAANILSQNNEKRINTLDTKVADIKNVSDGNKHDIESLTTNTIKPLESKVSNLLELNVVYPNTIRTLTTSSTVDEVKKAFTPVIGGSSGVVNTPHVGYLIKGATNEDGSGDAPDSAIISVDVSGSGSYAIHTFRYVDNNSDIVSVSVNFNSYDVTHKYIVTNISYLASSLGKFIYDANELLKLTENSASYEIAGALYPFSSINMPFEYRLPKTGDLLQFNSIGDLSLRAVESVSGDSLTLYISKPNGETIEGTFKIPFEDEGFSGWTVSEESKPMRYVYENFLRIYAIPDLTTEQIKLAATPRAITFSGSQDYKFTTDVLRMPQQNDLAIPSESEENEAFAISLIGTFYNKTLLSITTGSVDPKEGAIENPLICYIANDYSSAKAFLNSTLSKEKEELLDNISKIGTLRDLYIQAGAKYNGDTGYYELNGLTDITEEEMRAIYNRYLIDIGTNSVASGWLSIGITKIRTNLPSITRADIFGSMDNSMSGLYMEVLRICAADANDYNRVCYVSSSAAVAHGSWPKLKKVIGIWRYNNDNPNNFNFGYGQPFSNCPLLEEIRMARINKSHTFAVSPNLSKDSVLYMIQNANPPSGATAGSITITLHADAYARLKDDADIVAALEEKNGVVTLVSA